jgi:NAD(P)-dependent dehydrogenase (short-subunit alcohol dehydrogenase family)
VSKAALNMLTRSGAAYAAGLGVLMNAVDPGWSSSSEPTFRAPPLSADASAARVLYPVITRDRRYGRLFKNFALAEW